MMDQNHSSPDLLSKLPHNVSDEILLRLPFREAVCTSILSKEWTTHWCRLPHLTLHADSWKPKDLRATIRNIITRHSGSITKFTLCIKYWKIYPCISRLLHFLSRNRIQHLVLRLPKQFDLPPSFFKCLNLRHLVLQNCLLLPPPDFQGFNRLISLELHDVKISSKVLENFISRCLLLEQLVLKISDKLSDVIEINAPRLRSFDFKGDMETICLKCVPRLAKLSLMHYRKDWKKLDVANFLTSNFFESCSDLEHLHLDYVVVPRGQEIPTKLPLDMLCVKHLCMRICLGRNEILSALCLIRSFPFLEYLEIQMEFDSDNIVSDLDCLEVEAFPDVEFQHLTEVNLIEATGSIREMQLIKLLLAKSPKLRKMIINPERFLRESPIMNRCAEELTEFKHASRKAEVVFIEY